MKLFRSKWLDNDKIIRLLSNQHYNFIVQVYKDANVFVYKSYGEYLYVYYINFFYLYCMPKQMSVGIPKSYYINKGFN